MKKNKGKYQAIIYWLIVLLAITIYFMYIYYYYGSISIDSFIRHTVGSINILGNELKTIISVFISYNDVLQTFTLMTFIFIIIKYTKVNEILGSITNFEAGPVKVELDIEHANESLKELEKTVEDTPAEIEAEVLQSNVEEIDFNVTKIKIMQLIIDNPEIVEIIDKFMKNSRSVVIPMKRIHNYYKIECIDEIFNWEYKSNSIKITSIKENKSTALLDVYAELRSKEIIYNMA